MNWHLDALPGPQRDIWESRVCRGFPGWVLYGGTAIALRLGHRQSADFDFFTGASFSPLQFKKAMGLDGETLQAEPNTLTVMHRGVKLSFFGGLSLRVVKRPDLLEGCPVASLDDLAACKLAALVNRVELKDYIDVAAILRSGASLAGMLGCANTVYRGEFPVSACLKSLVYFDPPELAGLSSADRLLIERAALAVDAIPEVPDCGPLAGKP